MTRLYLLVSGRVQGVGYRWFIRDSAQSLGLSGWVRNRDDGAVDMEVEGPDGAVAEFKARAKSGHPFARVRGMDEKIIAPKKDESGFEIRRS